jgi:hypothetical protein
VMAKRGDDVTTDNLRANLVALPGVASAEVTLDDESVPVARVWLDGTLPGDDVRDLVDGLVASSMPSVVLPKQKAPRRRIGLGRGLVDLLPSQDTDLVPAQLQPSTSLGHSIVGIAVVESSEGVTVEIESDVGGVHRELVADEGDIDRAVMNGIAAIAGVGDDVQLEIAEVASGDGLVLVVSAFHGDERAVGAAFVEYGRPYALARAGLSALLGF